MTGAAGGIGSAIIERLQAEGAIVTAADLDLQVVDADHRISGDLTDAAYCRTLVDDACRRMGGLDILCNNAGIIRRGSITAATDEDFTLTVAINIEAPFRLCRAAIPRMAEGGGGAFINTASCWGLRPGPLHPLYCMSKAPLASLTQCLGRDHAHQGIRVNAVCPNEVDTAMLRTGFEIRGIDPEDGVAALDRTVPLGRIAKPGDIADVVAFLASDDAHYLCGALIEAHGGKPVG